MFDLLYNFFQSIGDFLQQVWDYILAFFQDLIVFFKMVGPTISFVIGLFRSIPSVYLVFGIALISVLIIYVILGRQAGGD